MEHGVSITHGVLFKVSWIIRLFVNLRNITFFITQQKKDRCGFIKNVYDA